MKKVKLNSLVSYEIKEKERKMILGGQEYGCRCGCKCCYANSGGSSTMDNMNANYSEALHYDGTVTSNC